MKVEEGGIRKQLTKMERKYGSLSNTQIGVGEFSF